VLGLAIAHQIVEQHGGLIRVASKPGVGTRFLIALPIRERKAAASS
jgi:signal transduction histidine kinase